MSKDLFSQQAKAYARYRPGYPKELFDYIIQFVEQRNSAWDCATGNGQAAVMLSDYFDLVEATDISEAQLKNVVTKANILYTACPAEATPFADNSFDLITVAQAYHWINWKKFRQEALRVAKQNAVVAIWVYNLFTSDDERLNELIRHFYFDIIGPYWDAERKHVDANYQTVDFDFNPLPSKNFETKMEWKKDDLLGYLSSWSSVQHYINKNNSSPLSLIETELNSIWETGEKEIRFPIYLRLARIQK